MEGRGGIKILSTALLAGTCPLCHNSDAIDEISSLRKAVDIIRGLAAASFSTALG